VISAVTLCGPTLALVNSVCVIFQGLSLPSSLRVLCGEATSASDKAVKAPTAPCKVKFGQDFGLSMNPRSIRSTPNSLLLL